MDVLLGLMLVFGGFVLGGVSGYCFQQVIEETKMNKAGSSAELSD